MNTAEEHIPFITSSENGFFKKIKSYLLAKNRKRDGVVLVEGKKFFKDASGRLNLRYTLTSEDYCPDSSDEAPLEHHTRLSNHLFNALSDTKTSQGIIGVFDLPDTKLDLSLLRRIIVLEGIQDPGNVGTIIRTASFLGYQAVLLDETCAAPLSPKVIRSSAGAVFQVPFSTAPVKQHLQDLKDANFIVVGGDLQGKDLRDHDALPTQQKLALLFGSEGQGLSEVALSFCDYRYRISAGDSFTESLNVAVASGIMMYQLNS